MATPLKIGFDLSLIMKTFDLEIDRKNHEL